jgi:DNA gyrase subunit A
MEQEDTPETPEGRDPPDRIRDLLIEDEMKTSYLRYAMSVIVSRALPDVRDGLKPSQRRILVAMHDLNLGPSSKYRKCAKIAGDTSGNYHPHGEGVIYPTLVRMAQPFNMRTPLVDGQGNFGSVDGDPPAAMRYTEARLASAATELLSDIDLDTVDFVANYDESRTEPTVLPARFPNLLVNGSVGIAVGMASNIPPHNPAEVADALIHFIRDPDCHLGTLMEVLPGPDFPTGGIICGKQGIVDAFATGRGRLVVRGRVRAEEEKAGRWALHVDEIPYPPRRDLIISKIAQLVKDGVIDGIARIEDYGDRSNPYRIYIQLKRGEDPKVVENLLYKHSPLQETFAVNTIALVNGRPETLSLKELLRCYRDYRIEVVRRRTRFLLEKAEARAHIVEGLLKALDVIDEVIETIRGSDNPEIAQARLVDRFEFSTRQAEAILRMTLSRLTGLEHRKLAEELEDLRRKIAEYRAILASEQKVLDVIVEELEKIKAKFGRKRLTEITGEEVLEFDREELVTPEDVVVTMSRGGYLKRVKLDTYRAQGRGGRGIIGADTKDEDIITHLWSAHTHDTLLFLTNQGRAFAKRVFEVPELRRTSAGHPLRHARRDREEGHAVAAAQRRTPDGDHRLRAGGRGHADRRGAPDGRRARPAGHHRRDGDPLPRGGRAPHGAQRPRRARHQAAPEGPRGRPGPGPPGHGDAHALRERLWQAHHARRVPGAVPRRPRPQGHPDLGEERPRRRRRGGRRGRRHRAHHRERHDHPHAGRRDLDDRAQHPGREGHEPQAGRPAPGRGGGGGRRRLKQRGARRHSPGAMP